MQGSESMLGAFEEQREGQCDCRRANRGESLELRSAWQARAGSWKALSQRRGSV